LRDRSLSEQEKTNPT